MFRAITKQRLGIIVLLAHTPGVQSFLNIVPRYTGQYQLSDLYLISLSFREFVLLLPSDYSCFKTGIMNEPSSQTLKRISVKCVL
jgi:hypothetical protein